MTTETVNIFEQASRMKLRFDTSVGRVSVEDLWDLPLSSSNKPNLDAIAVDLNRALKGTEESFVRNVKKDALLQLKFDIVKHVIDTRVAENAAKTEAAQKQAQRDKLDDLIARKEDAKLEELSVDELKEMRKAL